MRGAVICAGETGSSSSQVLSAAQSLSGDFIRLKLEVGSPRYGESGLTAAAGVNTQHAADCCR
jgi:hypothetical protein